MQSLAIVTISEYLEYNVPPSKFAVRSKCRAHALTSLCCVATTVIERTVQ